MRYPLFLDFTNVCEAGSLGSSDVYKPCRRRDNRYSFQVFLEPESGLAVTFFGGHSMDNSDMLHKHGRIDR